MAKQDKETILILDNGQTFIGQQLGYRGTVVGEVCFNTSMTGYQEILTDPSYYGQIITMTYPHIGNYGTNNQDNESSKVHARGFIAKEISEIASNYRSEESLPDYLDRNKVVGIEGIDTRMLTRILRNEGSMNGIISSDGHSISKLKAMLKKAPSMDGLNLIPDVSTHKSYKWHSSHDNINDKEHKIAVLDFGIKHNILRLLEQRGCDLYVLPGYSKADEILEIEPDALFLSNGPGDPSEAGDVISTIQELLGQLPIFGICLGHQILALSLGARTYKLKFGHRGANHPILNHDTGRVEITSQNHGFAVLQDSIPDTVNVTHTNLNDGTVAGIENIGKGVFSVQYHPESSPGPHDSRYLFEKFIYMIEEYKSTRQIHGKKR